MVTLYTNKGTPFYVSKADLPKLKGIRSFNEHSAGYVIFSKGNKKVYLHRYVTGAGRGFEVDHINGNKKDNTRENLRVTDKSVNGLNRHKVNANSTTGVTGVSELRNGRYRAYIANGGKQTHLGVFDTVKQAHEAYLTAREKLLGG